MTDLCLVVVIPDLGQEDILLGHGVGFGRLDLDQSVDRQLIPIRVLLDYTLIERCAGICCRPAPAVHALDFLAVCRDLAVLAECQRGRIVLGYRVIDLFGKGDLCAAQLDAQLIDLVYLECGGIDEIKMGVQLVADVDIRIEQLAIILHEVIGGYCVKPGGVAQSDLIDRPGHVCCIHMDIAQCICQICIPSHIQDRGILYCAVVILEGNAVHAPLGCEAGRINGHFLYPVRIIHNNAVSVAVDHIHAVLRADDLTVISNGIRIGRRICSDELKLCPICLFTVDVRGDLHTVAGGSGRAELEGELLAGIVGVDILTNCQRRVNCGLLDSREGVIGVDLDNQIAGAGDLLGIVLTNRHRDLLRLYDLNVILGICCAVALRCCHFLDDIFAGLQVIQGVRVLAGGGNSRVRKRVVICREHTDLRACECLLIAVKLIDICRVGLLGFTLTDLAVEEVPLSIDIRHIACTVQPAGGSTGDPDD